MEHDKPVRIGVNWGSLDQELLTELMDANARLAAPRDSRDVMIEAMWPRPSGRPSWPKPRDWRTTASSSAPRSVGVQDLVDVYRLLAPRCDYPLHLGLTEAGWA